MKQSNTITSLFCIKISFLFFLLIDHCSSTTLSERYFRPIVLESSSVNNQDGSKRHPLVQIPSTCLSTNQYQFPQPSSNILSTISSSQSELFSAFTYVPSSKQTTLNTKKYSNHNPILADQSSSSADSGVHSSFTQSPIIKHSFLKYTDEFQNSCFFLELFLDVIYVDYHLIVHHRSILMKIMKNIFMQHTINVLLFRGSIFISIF